LITRSGVAFLRARATKNATHGTHMPGDYIPNQRDYMEVGIRELKAKLSEYVSMAEQGRDIVVTDRGRPVARLLPYSETSAFDQGIALGWIEAPRRVGLALHTPHAGRESVLDVLADDRG
jgi:prevent-host-death family protein